MFYKPNHSFIFSSKSNFEADPTILTALSHKTPESKIMNSALSFSTQVSMSKVSIFFYTLLRIILLENDQVVWVPLELCTPLLQYLKILYKGGLNIQNTLFSSPI